jgi:flagellar basal-body rod protein FlgF
MFSELYVAASGMAARQEQMDIIANNLANVNTVGFKMDEASMEERRISTPAGPVRAPSHVRRAERRIDLSPGEIQTTGEPLDLALGGDGFFVVQAPGGMRLTRDGRFSVDKDGRLVLQGMPVLGDRGEIRIPDGLEKVQEDGRILSGGKEVTRLRVVTVGSPQELERDGAGLYRVSDEAQIKAAPAPRVLQGHLESSNAHPIQLMVQMIEAVRNFEMHQRMVQTLDRLGEKAVQELGRTA